MTQRAAHRFGHNRAEERRPSWFDRLRGLVLALACAAPLAFGVAYAQSAPPQTRTTADSNGVDVVGGQILIPSPAISIGQPGMGGLTYQRTYDSSIQDWRDNLTGAIDKDGATYTVTLMGAAEEFTESAGAFTSSEGRGGTLTFSSASNTYTYTTAGGAVALYDKDLASEQPTQANEGRIVSLTLPSGEVATFTYTELRTPALPATPTFLAHRLQSVTNNLGYQVALEYENNDADASGINVIKVTTLNNGVDYCSPTANGCTFSQPWPTLTFGMDGTAQTITDSMSRTWRYARSGSPQRITGIRWPGSGSDNITISYNASTGRVQSVSNGVGTWTYGFSVSGTTMTMSRTDPLSHSVVFQSDTATNRVTSYRDALLRTTSYQYDSLGRLTRVTQPEGNYTQFTYDARGNVIQTRQVAKAGSGLADTVTSAAYPASCTNPVTCNLPTSTTDARGFRADYSYDPTHGGLLSVTSPAPFGAAPIGTGTRPQTRHAYTQMYASYRQSGGGGVTQAPSAVYRLTETSACATAASCDGGADETATAVAYDTPDTFNNLLPSSVSSGAGNGTLTVTTTTTYDSIGNALTVDGPLAGSGDAVRTRYDSLRRRIGVVGPDPDGAGALKHGAVRYTYNTQGWVTAVDQGTVNSQSDADWSSFAALETLSAIYDSIGRRTRASFVAGGATHAVAQYSYDNANRLDCATVRMNPAVFGSLPASACTLGTEGANGPDRITRTAYDNNNRVTQVTSAYGTSAQQNTVTQTWTWNGLLGSLRDANNNLTTYEFDGFDRLRKIRFPNASGGGSSTTDYEQYTYDAGSNVTQDRRRDGATINFAYDNLNRATTMTPSTGAVVSYAYDNFSRLTQAISEEGVTDHVLTFGYDQLSRNTSAGGPLGTVSYQYDLAGRSTRVTWPDSFCAQYAYDLANAVTQISAEGASCTATTLATYAFDNLGRRTSVTRGNGVVTTYDFDAAGRLEELMQQLSGSSHDQTLTFAYNAAGQAVTRAGANAAYDWDQPAPSVANSTANGLNQIAALSGTNFTYDVRGNLTSTGSATYSYDVYNRLTGANGATLAYDPAGRLHQTVGGGVTTRFLYDGVDMVAEYNAAGTQLLRRYVHGPGVDEPIVWYEGSGFSDRRWLVQDRLGSVIAVTDGAGAATYVNTYDEYGVPGSSNAGRFQYTGQMWIAEAGLYHYKARAYAPSLGRFLQSDPILYAGGMNLYAYVGNDPVNAIDPTGKDAWVIARPAVGGLGGHSFVVVRGPTGGLTIFNAGPFGVYLAPGRGAGRDLPTARSFFAGGDCDCNAYQIKGFSDDQVMAAGYATVALFDGDLLYNYLAFGCCNSSTFVSMLLRKLGIKDPSPPPAGYPFGFPGWGEIYTPRTHQEMAALSSGHAAIYYGWNINSTMLDSAFTPLFPGFAAPLMDDVIGTGAAFMRRFQMSEFEQMVARIENMPYETMATSAR